MGVEEEAAQLVLLLCVISRLYYLPTCSIMDSDLFISLRYYQHRLIEIIFI